MITNELLLRIITDAELLNFFQRVGVWDILSYDQKNVFQKAVNFKEKHGATLSLDEALILFSDKRLDVDAEISKDFTLDYVYSQVKTEKLKEWILRVATAIEKGTVDYDKTFEELKSLKERLSLIQSAGVNASTAVLDIINYEALRHEYDVISTGIKALDYALSGGLRKEEIFFVLAPPGRGKSTFLLNLVYGFALSRKNILFLTNELSKEAILSRLYRRILKQTRDEYLTKVEENKKHIHRFFAYTKSNIIVHYVDAESWSIDDVKNWVTAWEHQLSAPIDVVAIDYFDRLKKPWHKDERIKLRLLVDKARVLAVEKSLLIITASQTNRASLSAPLITEEHVSESFAKIESADIVLSLTQLPEERKENKARLTILKNREFGGVGSIIDVSVDWDRLTITDLPVNEDDFDDL